MGLRNPGIAEKTTGTLLERNNAERLAALVGLAEDRLKVEQAILEQLTYIAQVLHRQETQDSRV